MRDQPHLVPTPEIKTPPASATRLGRDLGQEVTLGIRPKDLHMATAADPAGLSFEAVAEVVEQLGSEVLLDVAAGSNSMVASVDPSVRVNVRDRVRLALDSERLHFFDSASEVAI